MTCCRAKRTDPVERPAPKTSRFRFLNPALHAELMRQQRKAEDRFRARKRWQVERVRRAGTHVRKLINELNHAVEVGRSSAGW